MKPSLLAAICCIMALGLRADEGMWLYNQPPRQLLRERHQFDATDAWMEHLQKSSVRFNSGGSGSFVSEDGLLISNHHVGADSLQKLSTKEKNYLRDGFYARTPAQEMKCLDLELNVLQSIEDVTARINAAVPKDADAATAFAARRKIIAEVEKESMDHTSLRSDVVTLWQGGAYHLYRFKRYTDVRIVFAPEQQIAFYGGDPDNFEFPRHDLDICLFRAYENGQPAKVKDFLRFSPTGARDGELIFVSGHPGRTGRLLTVAELEYVREQALPFRLGNLKRLEVLLGNWSARSEENARRARDDFFSVQNSRKAIDGMLAGLLDPDLFSAKVKGEADFKGKLAGKPEAADALAAYDKIAEATKILAAQATRSGLLEGGQAFNCESFHLARSLLRAGDERPKPNGERLREFSDSGKVSLELALFSEKPIYTDLEILTLADSLTFLCGKLGATDPLVQKTLAGKSPRDRAVELINGTKVRDVALRKKLYEGGASAVSAANDPMIDLARLVDADARALRKVSEDQGETKQQAHAAISRARNELLGTAGYPDATFTLRLAFGLVKGYEEDGKPVPALTTFGSLYERAKEMKNQSPFDLPPLWEKRKSRLNLKTPFNFVSTADIIGGNSGSPVVNRAGEFVGIIFDGNLQSLPWDYVFSDKQGRATSVHSAAILEALNKVYGAKELARELVNGSGTVVLP
ncbi:MAG TPA: S46 family peptidase [Verrucomicrobiae bacterium]|nr:S46 family peptidase [Verrucomicrobiae bacterium]